jgi:hypothetical protein
MLEEFRDAAWSWQRSSSPQGLKPGMQMIFNAGMNACSTLARWKNSLMLHGRGKHPRGSSLAVADAPASLGMTEGKRIANIRKDCQDCQNCQNRRN